jgi:hypothetical protein
MVYVILFWYDRQVIQGLKAHHQPKYIFFRFTFELPTKLIFF